MRIMQRAWGLAALVAASLILASGAPAADQPSVHVKAVVKGDTVSLEAQANGPFEYTTYRPSESLYILDLSGVSAADPAGARIVPSELVKSYRELSYSSGQKPVVRLEILLSQGVEPRLERKDNQELTLLVSRTNDASSVPSAAAVRPVAAKSDETIARGSALEAIEQVSLAQDGDETDVNVLASGRLAYHVIRLENPDRLVLDFSGAHLKTSTKRIASNLDPVREIRLAQYKPGVSRMVIDLRQPAHYNINAVGNALTVAFAPPAATRGNVNSDPSGAPSNLTTTKAAAPARAAEEATSATNASNSSVPAPAATLPATLTQRTVALAVPAETEQPKAAEVVATFPVPPSVSNASAAPELAPAVPADQAIPQQQPAAAPTGKYTGEPISVNLKDVDLRDFFRLIHEISGLNVVLDPNVKGTLTIVLDDVPWDQALDIVLHNNDLGEQLDGNVLRVATKETLKKEAEESRDLAKAQAEAADVVTTTRVLSYAKSDDLVPTVKKFLSSRGDVLSDSRSNTLIIRDIPSVLPVIDNLIRQLDRKSQQVEIEARVVAANRNFAREIGTQFGFAIGAASAHNFQAVGGAPSVGSSPTAFGPPPPPIFVSSGGGSAPTGAVPIPLNTNLGASVATSALQYLFTSDNFALDFVISAAEDRGVGKLLSKPKVITQNNQKATVKQGTRIPVQTIINNTISVQYVDAVLELDVTPQITADGTVFMDVQVKNDQIDQAIPRVQGIPAIDTQAAETKVLINDGGTVVIGGIIVSQQRTDVQQVPLFGSLPLIGNLFKHTTVNSQSQELLFFLTPRILPS
ncbi:MAG: type IV pilus secretin PilQ [Candidatus Acidiferrales bacterium]